jgi:serine/threonine protein kinase
MDGTETIPPAPPKKPELAEGDLFHDRYVIQQQLGAGAMGVVYVALDQLTRTPVALKLINSALADRPAARERFVREGLMARDVRHSNVVAMYDVGEADGQVYLSMEYLRGETLRRWLHRTLQGGRDVPFDTARGIIRSVLDGLAAAHAKGVVHRDLKPENVMLTGDPDKGDFSLKILDFGIARAVGAPSNVTTTSASTGTPLYMAPEQKTAADTVGPPADLYAVTAMLYELLQGVAPEGRWAPPSRERKDLPAGIDAVIETGLANRPRSRYQTAGEYIDALDAVDKVARTTEKPVEPPPPPEDKSWVTRLKTHSAGWGLWYRLSKPQRIILSVVLLVAMIAWIAYTVSPPTQPSWLVGRWADEIAGAGAPIAFVDFAQQGNTINGVVYDVYGNAAGRFTGQVQGTTLDYSYVANNGATGTGRGRLTDDNHLDVEVHDNVTGMTQRHTLHRNHMPPQ